MTSPSTAGRFDGREHILPVHIYFEDTDFSGLVYHANYLRYMERARSDMLACVGIGQRAAFERGEGVYAVAELTIKYHRPARFDDDLTVISTVETLRAASCVIHQRVMRGEERLTEAMVVAAFLSPDGRPRRQPEAWRAAFTSLLPKGRLMDLALNTNAATLSPLALFLQADIVVKLVMIGLLLASIWTWTIIIGQWIKLRKTAAASESYERAFEKAEDPHQFVRGHDGELPIAKVVEAALFEWKQSTKRTPIDREGTRARLMTTMGAAVAAEVDKLSDRLNILATVGSVAPFVGLFGTVWGIMRSFTAIGAAGNSSLAVVAPGIAEALFATAIGLFAAIPAVIAYNRFSHRINMMEARLNRFADGFHATLSRELEMA